jgi:hypothetical protein
MRSPMRKGSRRLPEEEAYRRLNEVIDFDLFCLGLEYDERLVAEIHESTRKRLDERQRAFDAMLTRHPATLAENVRRAETRRLEKERLEKIAERLSEREERKTCAGVRHLARRWHAKLAPAHAN